MNKAELRHQLKKQREGLNPKAVETMSHTVSAAVIEILNTLSISDLHTYRPIEGQNEIDTRPLLETLWQRRPQIRTATWKKVGHDYSQVWIDKDGVEEPVPAGQQFSAIIIPMLGFNDSLHRLGFGGGHYDRFLASQKKAKKIGLCYEFGRVAFTAEAHDIPMDIVVTENTIYRVN